MLWALINRYHYGYDVRIVNFPVYHSRTVKTKYDIDIKKTIQEIHGASLYAGLSEFYSWNGLTKFDFSEQQMDQICEIASKYFECRMTNYKLNFERIGELCIELERYSKYMQVKEYLEKIHSIFSEENINNFVIDSRKLDSDEIKRSLISISTQIDDYSNASSETRLFEMGDT